MGSFSFGDQIREIHVRDYGLYSMQSDCRKYHCRLQWQWKPGTFQQATISSNMTFRMTAVALDQNATYEDQNPQNNASAWRWRSLYEAQPVLNIIDFDGISVNLVDQS